VDVTLHSRKQYAIGRTRCEGRHRSISELDDDTRQNGALDDMLLKPEPEILRRKVSSLPVTSVMVFNGGVGKRLLNVEEAAGYLGLKVDTVYKKARLRELPFVKVGRALRFDKQALDRLIEQHTIKTID
jgi:excisionase family DNA binding protein